MAKTINTRQAAQMDIYARQGASFNRVFHCQFLSGSTYYNFDLQAYTGATMQVRRSPSAPIAELTFTTTDNSIKLLSNGRLQLITSDANMLKIRPGEYDYDMYLSSSTIEKRDFLYGKFIIENKITT